MRLATRPRGDMERNRNDKRPRAAMAQGEPPPSSLTIKDTAHPPLLRTGPLRVVGNAAAWAEACAAVRAGGIVVIRGPPGVGKTHGAKEVARACRRRCVMIACAELASTERNAEELRSELTVAATRAGGGLGDDESSQARLAPLVVLDDVDALPSSLAQQVAAFLSTSRTPVVVTCGRTPPRWLRSVGAVKEGERGGRHHPSSTSSANPPHDLLLPSHQSSLPPPSPPVTCFLSPLLEDELRQVAVAAGVPMPRPVAEACLRAANGDARAFLNSLRLHGASTTTTTATTSSASVSGGGVGRAEMDFNEWTASAYLLRAKLSDQTVERLATLMPLESIGGILHANYVQSITEGVRSSFDDANFVSRFTLRADCLSSADAMRSGPARRATDPASYLAASVAIGMGRKTRVPTDAKLIAPRRTPPSSSLLHSDSAQQALNSLYRS